MRIGIARGTVNVIFRNQTAVRFEPNAVFDAADVTVSNGGAISTQYNDTRISTAPDNVAILNRNVRRIDINIVRLTITHRHASVVDNEGAIDIKPLNDLSSRA